MHIERSIVLPGPPADVWRFITERDLLRLWLSGVIEDEPTSDGPLGVGSTSRIRMREGKQVSEYECVVTQCDVDEHFAIQLTGGTLRGNPMDVDYKLHELDGRRTRLHYTASAPLENFAAPLKVLVHVMARLNTRSTLGKLRKVMADQKSSAAT